jgi:hypothetical protein
MCSATVKPARPAPIMSTGRSALASEKFGEGFELAIDHFKGQLVLMIQK